MNNAFGCRFLRKINILVWGTVFIFSRVVLAAEPGNGEFNYAEALQKTILFYEIQRSGALSTADIPTRISWRGDSQLTDGAAEGVDLVGGVVDAGDNMKYGFPAAAAATYLAWGLIEYEQAYKDAGQYQWMLNQLKWINDYFIKAHTSPNELWVNVGVTESDHSFWGPIESTQYYTDRTAYKIDASHPGSDAAAVTAAAMASAALVFKSVDEAYQATLLRHAKELYSFADTYRGAYDDSIDDPDTYHSYSGYDDELVWGAIWLYKATHNAAYLDKAVAYYGNLGKDEDSDYYKYKWTFNWDDSTYACYLLMAKLIPGEKKYQEDVERWLDWWTVGFGESRVPYTPGGHARLDDWGSLRYAANTAFGAFVYADWITDPAKKAQYQNFAEAQINYILGDNPRKSSYICGFGKNPPQHPHHRTAHGAWGRRQETPAEHRHILYGALVGSPTLSDTYTDVISDPVSNEVALDYNAALVPCLAKMFSLYGGTPIPDSAFPLPDKPYVPTDEWAVFAKTYSDHAYGTTVSVTVENRTAWPARPSDTLKIRYFFTLDAESIADCTASVGSPADAVITQPILWNAAEKIYYVEVSLTGIVVAPGYLFDIAGPVVDFSIGSNSGSWDSSNDWSDMNRDMNHLSVDRAHAVNIPMYEADTLLFGSEPGSDGTGPVTPEPPSTDGLVGDVNGNGSVDITDALLIAQYDAGLNPSGFLPENADANCSGDIDSSDAVSVAHYYVGLINGFCK